jgi:acetoin utilization deacetylase AcuC-like enzyme
MYNKNVAYFYDRDVANFHYGESHPMKPHRLALTHSLIINYDLFKKMKVYKPRRASLEDLIAYHGKEYVEFLQRVAPDTSAKETSKFNIVGDCPGFPSVYEFCQVYAGGSIDAAHKINHKDADICINWAGGLHHARRDEASGFCYVNDIVLAILELLKYHSRVLYIDIDVHHGDGVQDAFYLSDRVMCVSLHKYGDGFFPGSGNTDEIGRGAGRFYSLNVPLHDGVEDAQYQSLYEPIIQAVIDKFRPDVIALQCGADSLKDDRIGVFNLSLYGHAQCVEFVKKFNLPIIVMGGGGYTIRNVARCWAKETALLVDTPIAMDIPFNEYFEQYAPSYQLHPPPLYHFDNKNTPQYIDDVRRTVLEQLRQLECAPSVQMHYVPKDFFMEDLAEDEDSYDSNGDFSTENDDLKVDRGDEFYDNDRDIDHDTANRDDYCY